MSRTVVERGRRCAYSGIPVSTPCGFVFRRVIDGLDAESECHTKIRYSFILMKTPSEHIPDIRAGLQINHPSYITVHQFDEEHSERTVYHEPRYSVSTCIRVHSSTGYSLEERPQSEEQGLSLDQCTMRSLLTLLIGGLQTSI